jgi:hypothetical protein
VAPSIVVEPLPNPGKEIDMKMLRTTLAAAVIMISAPVFAQYVDPPEPNAPPTAGPGVGTVPGAVGGAVIGGVVGGPPGAVVGGIIGGAAGATMTPPPAGVHTFVMEERVPSVVYGGQLVVGAPAPRGVILRPVPRYDRYRFAMINDRRVIVDRNSGRIVEID